LLHCTGTDGAAEEATHTVAALVAASLGT